MDIIFCKITHFMDINLQTDALFFLNLTANTKKIGKAAAFPIHTVEKEKNYSSSLSRRCCT